MGKSSDTLEDNIKFEEALEELEQITKSLEDGKDSLENSMKLYERGMLLREFCERKLKEAEGKWKVLKKGKNGDIISEEIKAADLEENEQGSMF